MAESLLEIWRSLTDPDRLLHLLSSVMTGWLGYALLCGIVFATASLCCLLLPFVGGLIKGRFALLSMLFLANSATLLGVPLQYGPLWSLAVEEHFYMLWPTLVRRFSCRRQLSLLLGIIVASPILRAITFAHLEETYSGRPLYTWFNLNGLAVGAVLAIWLHHPSFRRVHLLRMDLPPKMRQPVKRQNPWNGENESWDCLAGGLLGSSS